MKLKQTWIIWGVAGFISLLAAAQGGISDEARHHYFNGDSRPAFEEYQAALKERPAALEALDTCVVARDLGETEEALKLLEALPPNIATDDRIIQAKASLYLNQGNFKEARDLYQRMVSQSTATTPATLGLGRSLFECGESTAALRILSEFVNANPRSTLGYFFLAQAQERFGKPDEAIASYTKALKEDSHFVEVRPFLARLYEEKKSIDDAWKQYAKMAQSDSKNKAAKAGLNRLASLITKKPEEILPPRKIPSHTALPPIGAVIKGTVIKVGIGTSASGAPTPKSSVSFRTSNPYLIVDPDNGKTLLSGEAVLPVKIRLNDKGDRAEIVDSSGQVRGQFKESIFIDQRSTSPTTNILNSLSFAPDTSWGGMADKEIRGRLEIRVNREEKTLVLINHLTIEEYLYGVLAAEMPSHWPLEALKAQAVIARTQVLYRKNLHKKYGYDVCDEQHCQVYTGVGVETPKTRTAVDETRGMVLTFDGKLAHTVFSSNCGGETQTGVQAGWGDVPYWQAVYDGKPGTMKPSSPYELSEWLQNVPPAYCEASKYTWFPEYRWARVVRVSDIASKVESKKNVGRVEKIQILKRNPTGRVQRVRIEGSEGHLDLTKEHEIRKYLGLGSLRSTLFVIEPVYRNGQLESVIFTGGGWGHGVGFCQSGAAGMGEANIKYPDILSHYFPGTKLSNW